MQSREPELLLQMVERLHSKLDRYVAESTLPAVEVPEIFKFCQRVRAMNPDSTIEYWLAAIERHATEISDPHAPSEEIGSLPRSARLLDSHLHVLKDVHNLRTWLKQPHAAVGSGERLSELHEISPI